MKTLSDIKQTTEEKQKDPEQGWRTILHNDNVHTFESVISQLIKALGCSFEEAKRYTHMAHTYGKAKVFKGTQKQCDAIADVLAEIGLRVTISK